MSVLVDTPIWSSLFRRARTAAPEAATLRQLIEHGQAQIIGPVRQEVLSGIRTTEQFVRLRDALRSFLDIALNEAHFELAAEFFNACRSKGVQGSNTDFLICAVAHLEGMRILTTDNDFALYSRHLPIERL
jgi:predicted nucleic acid-binding protein